MRRRRFASTRCRGGMSRIETAKAGGLPATDRAAMPLAARPVTVSKKRTRIGGAAGARACANLSRARLAERMNTDGHRAAGERQCHAVALAVVCASKTSRIVVEKAYGLIAISKSIFYTVDKLCILIEENDPTTHHYIPAAAQVDYLVAGSNPTSVRRADRRQWIGKDSHAGSTQAWSPEILNRTKS